MQKKILFTAFTLFCALPSIAAPNCANGDPSTGWGNESPEDEAICSQKYFENLQKKDPEKFFELCKLDSCDIKWKDIMTYAAASDVLGSGFDPNQNLRDNKSSTAWAAKSNTKKNLTIAIRVNGKIVAGFSIDNGMQKDQESFDKNGAIKQISVYHDEVTEANKVGTFVIEKNMGTQFFPFERLYKKTQKFFFHIDETYDNEENTVCATELHLLGN